VGKVVQPLQSVNYHDSHAHGHDLSGFLGPDGLVHGMQQVRSPCAQFGYRWDACEH
jgi:hypothetical protein